MIHPAVTYNESSSNGRPFPITLSIDALESIGRTINFIDNWLQYFSENCEVRTFLYKQKMQDLFK